MSHTGRGVGLYVWKTKGWERGMWKGNNCGSASRDHENWITWVQEGDQGAKKGCVLDRKGDQEGM